MAQKRNRDVIAAQADLHVAMPVTGPLAHEVDRTFELPPMLYAGTVACYLAFLGVTGAAFANPGLILPMAIFTIFIIGGFGLPAVWASMDPAKLAHAKSWLRFKRDGITTLTGHNTASQATVQVLILPALILVWGVAIATIAAVVR